MQEDCYTATVYHYTDWYTKDGVYTNSTLDYISYETVCYSTFIPELSSTGGGGAGTYYSSGSGSTYADCGDPVHGCLFKLKDKVATADTWENEEIDDSKLAPCMKSILSDLKNLDTGIGQIVSLFASSIPDYNWTVQDGHLNGETGNTPAFFDQRTCSVSSTFDSKSWPRATDLSWARTMMHEAVHAYLVSWWKNNMDYDVRLDTYPMLLKDYADQTVGIEQAQHNEMIRKFVDKIASGLQEFGEKRGYNLTQQFYNDLAWGGLTHRYDENGNPVEMQWFKSLVPNSSDRKRILDVINTELTGKDNEGSDKTQKGKNAGC